MRVITEHYEVAGPGLHRLAVGVHVYSALQHLAARAARGRVRLHSAQSPATASWSAHWRGNLTLGERWTGPRSVCDNTHAPRAL